MAPRIDTSRPRRGVNDEAGDVELFERHQRLDPGGPATSWYIQTRKP